MWLCLVWSHLRTLYKLKGKHGDFCAAHTQTHKTLNSMWAQFCTILRNMRFLVVWAALACTDCTFLYKYSVFIAVMLNKIQKLSHLSQKKDLFKNKVVSLLLIKDCENKENAVTAIIISVFFPLGQWPFTTFLLNSAGMLRNKTFKQCQAWKTKYW